MTGVDIRMLVCEGKCNLPEVHLEAARLVARPRVESNRVDGEGHTVLTTVDALSEGERAVLRSLKHTAHRRDGVAMTGKSVHPRYACLTCGATRIYG